MKRCLWWIVLGIVILGIIWLVVSRNTKTEGFDILGALAPYKEAIYECERDCEREDPSKRLLASGNIGCDAYCQSVFSDMAQKNLPTVPVVTSYDTCEKQCSQGKFAKDPIAKDKCISMCHCHEEVKKWCRELQCPYSKQDPNECMEQCIATQMVNCNQVGWSWLSH